MAVKKKFLMAVFFALSVILCGCGVQTESVPETTAVQAEAATVPTEPVPTETEAEHDIELYELDTSEYDFTFEKVLLRFDWTDMTFALKCFDGSVITGTVEKDEYDTICTYEGGRLILSWGLDDGKKYWMNTSYHDAEERNYAVDQVMFCPQTEGDLSCRFVLAEDQEQEIVADPEAVPLDSYKHTYSEYYNFHCWTEDGEESVGLGIRYYPMQEKWAFSISSEHIEVDYTENPDGTITFSRNGKHWNFHREGEDLYFDGGDTLIADNGVDPKASYYRKMDVPVGSVMYLRSMDYVYDALYILPGGTLEECYTAIQLDTKNQWIRIRCWDGKVLTGPYTIDDYGTYIQCQFEIPDYVGTRIAYINLHPSGHALSVTNPWMLEICPEELSEHNLFYLFPVQGVTPQEAIEE